MTKIILKKIFNAYNEVRAKVGTGFCPNPEERMDQIVNNLLATLPDHAEYQWDDHNVNGELGVNRLLLTISVPYLTVRGTEKTTNAYFLFVVYRGGEYGGYRPELLTYCTNSDL